MNLHYYIKIMAVVIIYSHFTIAVTIGQWYDMREQMIMQRPRIAAVNVQTVEVAAPAGSGMDLLPPGRLAASFPLSKADCSNSVPS